MLVRVRDQPGALERVLGLARRRAMSLEMDSVARAADGGWSVVFRATDPAARLDHYVHEFKELVDLDEALPLRTPNVDGADP